MIIIDKTKISLDGYNGYSPEEVENIPITHLPMYLGEPIKIKEGVTFGRIFDICIMNRNIFNIVFHSFTSGFNIDMFIDDYVKEPKEDDFVTDIDYLEVYRSYEHMVFDDGSVNHDYYYGIHGVGKPDKLGETNYSIGFTSLSKLKSLPIKTNNELDITVDTGLDFDAEGFKFEDKYKSLHKAEIPITLFNFIGAILYELTFHGVPINRDEMMDGLIETSRQVEAGEMETYELLKDENGKHYFLDNEGNKDYFLDETE